MYDTILFDDIVRLAHFENHLQQDWILTNSGAERVAV